MSPDSSRCVPITMSTLPSLTPGDDLLGLRGREEAREHLDAHRVAGEALGERLAVLLGEQRRRHEHRDLLAVLDGLERGPQRHLGLAEADVAAQQPVHRPVGLHVGLDRFDGRQLVGRLLVRERLLELALPRACRARTRAPRR